MKTLDDEVKILDDPQPFAEKAYEQGYRDYNDLTQNDQDSVECFLADHGLADLDTSNYWWKPCEYQGQDDFAQVATWLTFNVKTGV